MGGMELDAIIAGFARPRRAVGEHLDDPVDLGRRKAVDRLPPARARHFKEMDDLRHDLRIRRSVHAIDEGAMAGDEAVVGEAQQRPRFVAVDCRRLDHDEPDMALGIADVAVDYRVVDVAVLARKPRHHRRHDHPVGDRHAVDAELLEELHRCTSRIPLPNPPPLAGEGRVGAPAPGLQ